MCQKVFSVWCIIFFLRRSVCRALEGTGGSAGHQPHDTQAPLQVLDSGQLWRHVPRGQPQRVGTLWPDHAARLLGAQLRLPAQLLLQRLHQQVCSSDLLSTALCIWLTNVGALKMLLFDVRWNKIMMLNVAFYKLKRINSRIKVFNVNLNVCNIHHFDWRSDFDGSPPCFQVRAHHPALLSGVPEGQATKRSAALPVRVKGQYPARLHHSFSSENNLFSLFIVTVGWLWTHKLRRNHSVRQ